MNDPAGRPPETIRPDWLPRPFAAATAALGAGVLVGWLVELEPLTRVLPGLITMKPNAALSFLLGGLALWSIGDGPSAVRRAVWLSLAVAAIGGASLFEYVAGVDLGIDELLFREAPGQVGTLYRGRMHPTTAFDFVTLGVASAFLAADREHRAAQWMALMAASIAGATLIGYLYGVREFVGLAMFSQMALHTTIGMLTLSGGLLLARRRRGLMVSIADDGPSGQMARRLLPVAILTPIVATGLTILAREAGLFDERYASAVRVTSVVAVFVACIWWSANSLLRIDRDRRRVDSERVEGAERSRFLAESMPQIVWIARPDGEVEYLNKKWFDYTGQDPARGPDWRPILHPDDLGPCLQLWASSTLSGQSFQGEYRYRRHDGAYRWHLARAEPMRDEDGRVVQWVGTSTDVDDQRRAGEQRYRSLVEATTAIVWNTPSSGEFEAEQPAWGTFTGQAFEQLKGWGWIEAIHPDDRAVTAQAWAVAVEGRSTYEVKHRLRKHDGEFRHMLVRAVPLLDELGEVREWIGVHTDVDDQERANEAMREAKEAAEAATRAKAEFLANMSHEIRTPMNGVLGMTELALGTDLTPRQRDYLEMVKSSAEALLTVIDDILDFSKIEAGKLTLDPVPFPPRDVVTDTLRCLALKAYEKGLELACRVAPGVPEQVVGDPGRLRQVLVNLVGNAIKFTHKGEVVVTVEPEPGEGPSTVRFSVADTGIGIPAEKRASIFNPFEQADGSTTRKYGGTGLGLSISSRLIDLMGGRIWVDENPEGGSIFRFTARLDRDPVGRPSRPSSGKIVLDGLLILIVDDNRTNRMILEELLSQWGCRPLAVEGGAEAIVAMGRASDRGEPFPLVLLDRMMPEMDGCTLAWRLRQDPRHAGARFLMLTSGGADEACRAPELGIGAWLAKPVRQSELLEAILDLLGPEQASPRPVAPSPVAPSPVPLARSLRILLAEDHPINQKVATRMLQDQGHEVTVVGNGRLAVEAIERDASGFDAVLMDLAMPEMGGFQALEAIRLLEAAGNGRLPIIALTAHAMAGDRERCLAAGFDDYLSKPVQSVRLAEALARVAVGGPRGDRDHPVTPADPPPSGQPVFDYEAAAKALGGDETLLLEILGIFLEDAPRLLDQARAAIDADDVPTLARLGHTLAGSAGHLAAERVIAAARKLEAIAKQGDLAEAHRAADAIAEEIDHFRLAAAAVLDRRPLIAAPDVSGQWPLSQ